MDVLPGSGPQPGGRWRSWWAHLSSGAKTWTIFGAGMLLFLVICCCGALAGPAEEEPPPAVVETTPVAPVAPPPSPAPTIEVRIVTESQKLAFSTKTIEDPDLRKGVKETRVKGVAGVKTLTYELTFTNGVQTGKRLAKSEVTRAPVTQLVAIGTYEEPESSCDPNYSGCVPIASDVDCAGGKGNGPAYVRGPVYVTGADVYDLDGDNDGVGCE